MGSGEHQAPPKGWDAQRSLDMVASILAGGGQGIFNEETGGGKGLTPRRFSLCELGTRRMGLHPRIQLLIERRPWLDSESFFLGSEAGGGMLRPNTLSVGVTHGAVGLGIQFLLCFLPCATTHNMGLIQSHSFGPFLLTTSIPHA